MNDVAVVKPDHLGDFILSIPAIRALARRFGSVTLFGSPSNRFLADHFVPEADFEPAPMKYLQKDGRGITHEALIERLKPFPVVVLLREDGYMMEVVRQLTSNRFIERGDFDTHDTVTQWKTVSRVIGPYSRRDYFPEPPESWPAQPRTIGLCVSAGFRSNNWPLTMWASLGRMLVEQRTIAVRVIGGPSERQQLDYLARALNLPIGQVIEGTRDVDGFLDRVAQCDVVVGTDSGTLHLVSTRVPTLGVFTSSPWKRFAPFGPANRLLTANVSCSPCMQFSWGHYNACFSRECAMLIEPEAIVEALFAPEHASGSVSVGHLQRVFDPARSLHDSLSPVPRQSVTRLAQQAIGS